MVEKSKYEKIGVKEIETNKSEMKEEVKNNKNNKEESSKTKQILELADLSKDENFQQASEILEGIFITYNKDCLGRVIGKLKNSKFCARYDWEREIIKNKKFSELRECRKEMLSRLEKNINNLRIEDQEKRELMFRVKLFKAMHSFFEKDLEASDDNLKMINVVSNQECANCQQEIAMEIIKKPDFSIREFEKYKEVAADYYQSEDLFESRKRGIYGLVGAYHYYSKKGNKVIFPYPKLDAKAMIDLFVIDDKDINEEARNELDQLNWGNLSSINKISDNLKRFIFKAQIKCHEEPLVPTKEKQYNYIADKEKKIRYNDPTYQFFISQGRATDFNCKQLDISLEDAQNLIDENRLKREK